MLVVVVSHLTEVALWATEVLVEPVGLGGWARLGGVAELADVPPSISEGVVVRARFPVMVAEPIMGAPSSLEIEHDVVVVGDVCRGEEELGL